MREIKFRGKRADNGKWVYGYLSQDSHHDMVISDVMITGKAAYEYKVIPKTIGQYIGIDDDSGDCADVGRVEVEMEDRDRRDKTRAVGPLARADDAIYVDSTGLSLEQVTDRMERRVRRSTE